MNYQEALSYMEHLNIFGIQLGLGRIKYLMELLGNPQDKYRTIHITGTNGKGSTSAMLASILTQSGLTTGLYTSPHLVSYTERMQIDGELISEEAFADCISRVREKVEIMLADGQEQPTLFEVITAAAFLYFADKKVDYAVIEVGLGGLLDSTNVITPEVSVITNITMEHADKCGGTLQGIAHHKAGIIKPGVPVVTAAKGEALEIILKEAEEKGSDVFVAGRDFQTQLTGFDGRVQHMGMLSEIFGIDNMEYDLQMLGSYQAENSSLAVITALLLGQGEESVTFETIRKGISLVQWPGRFERMDKGDTRIVIDGAHNPAGMTVLRQSLDYYFKDEKRVLLLGILKDKDIKTMLGILLRPEDIVVVTAPQSDRASDPAVVADHIKSMGLQNVEAVPDRDQALQHAMELAGNDHLLVCAGSLYLIGYLRKLLIEFNLNR